MVMESPKLKKNKTNSTIITCKYLLTFSNFLDEDMQYITFSGHHLCKP